MKKKGLIVATIVMVLVLAVSLTTATYAWFSSQASATVDDLQITTAAAQGLQIAMSSDGERNTDALVSGELDYLNNAWDGNPGWGTYLGFSTLEETTGTWEDAVTKYDGSGEGLPYYNGNYYLATSAGPEGTVYYTFVEHDGAAVSGTDYYTKGENVYNLVTEKERNTAGQLVTKLVSGTPYYKLTSKDGTTTFADDTSYLPSVSNITTAGFYVPNGYDANTQPTGYEKASANYHYYEFNMAITNIKPIAALGMGIVVTPTGSSSVGTSGTGTGKVPGMAAATRIELSFWKGATAGTFKNSADTAVTSPLEPFGSWELLANNQMQTSTNSGYSGKESGGDYQITLADGTATIEAGEVWYVSVRIWIEGTDKECDNRTAGTGYTVDIEFVYAEPVTSGTPTLEWGATSGMTYSTTPNEYTVTFPQQA